MILGISVLIISLIELTLCYGVYKRRRRRLQFFVEKRVEVFTNLYVEYEIKDEDLIYRLIDTEVESN